MMGMLTLQDRDGNNYKVSSANNTEELIHINKAYLNKVSWASGDRAITISTDLRFNIYPLPDKLAVLFFDTQYPAPENLVLFSLTDPDVKQIIKVPAFIGPETIKQSGQAAYAGQSVPDAKLGTFENFAGTREIEGRLHLVVNISTPTDHRGHEALLIEKRALDIEQAMFNNSWVVDRIIWG